MKRRLGKDHQEVGSKGQFWPPEYATKPADALDTLHQLQKFRLQEMEINALDPAKDPMLEWLFMREAQVVRVDYETYSSGGTAQDEKSWEDNYKKRMIGFIQNEGFEANADGKYVKVRESRSQIGLLAHHGGIDLLTETFPELVPPGAPPATKKEKVGKLTIDF